MNKHNYETYIISENHDWTFIKDYNSIINEDDFFDITNEHPNKWDMLKHSRIKPRCNFTYRYYIGYTLQNDYYDYNSNYENCSHYRKVSNCQFVDYGWLPFWGKATKKKATIINNIQNYYIKKILFYKYRFNPYIIDNIWIQINNLPLDIISYIYYFV
jgi:hypothetical protein